jgi:uncharacterized metal-binding protein YceD (DUF177 family)
MAAGLPDRVDCERLADDKAALQRVYELRELPRLQDLLADNQGSVHASFAFERVSDGRAGATVHVEAEPHLVCQRCLRGSPFAIDGTSEIEFADSEDVTPADPQREIYVMERGQVSLRDLVEEELLLAIPAVVVCTSPETCGKGPRVEEERSRPLAVLRDILKKT